MAMSMPITRGQIENFSEALVSSVAGDQANSKKRQTTLTLWKMVNNFNRLAEQSSETALIQDRNAKQNEKLIQQNLDLRDAFEGLEAVRVFMEKNAESEGIGADTLDRMDRLIASSESQLEVLEASAELNVSNTEAIKEALDEVQETASEFKPAIYKLTDSLKEKAKESLGGADSFLTGLLGDVLGIGGILPSGGLFTGITSALTSIKETLAVPESKASLEKGDDPNSNSDSYMKSSAKMLEEPVVANVFNKADNGDDETVELRNTGSILEDIYQDHGQLLENINEKLTKSVFSDDERLSKKSDSINDIASSISGKGGGKGGKGGGGIMDTIKNFLPEILGSGSGGTLAALGGTLTGGLGLSGLLGTSVGAIPALGAGAMAGAGGLVAGTAALGALAGYGITKIPVGGGRNVGDWGADKAFNTFGTSEDERIDELNEEQEKSGESHAFKSAIMIAQRRGVPIHRINRAIKNVNDGVWDLKTAGDVLRANTKAHVNNTNEKPEDPKPSDTSKESKGIKGSMPSLMRERIEADKKRLREAPLGISEYNKETGEYTTDSSSVTPKSTSEGDSRDGISVTKVKASDDTVPMSSSVDSMRAVKASRPQTIVQAPPPTIIQSVSKGSESAPAPNATIDDVGLRLINSSMLES